jgi:hypothetical protein
MMSDTELSLCIICVLGIMFKSSAYNHQAGTDGQMNRAGAGPVHPQSLIPDLVPTSSGCERREIIHAKRRNFERIDRLQELVVSEAIT